MYDIFNIDKNIHWNLNNGGGANIAVTFESAYDRQHDCDRIKQSCTNHHYNIVAFKSSIVELLPPMVFHQSRDEWRTLDIRRTQHFTGVRTYTSYAKVGGLTFLNFLLIIQELEIPNKYL